MFRLVAQLEAARRQRFVGRRAELTLWESALTTNPFPFLVLYVHGPGGIGKTTLLREFAHRARQRQFDIVHLDGHHLECSPDAFLTAIKQGLSLESTAALFDALAAHGQSILLIVDTYENLAPLDVWLRDTFLPQLPDTVVTLLAGRNPPSLGWRTDPGWQVLLHVIALRNLDLEDSRVYLQRRAVPDDQQRAVLNFAHGHPLALSLIADRLAQRPGILFEPTAAPDLIQLLVEQLAEEVPSPMHRASLEACALVRLMSEPLLEAMLAVPDVHAIFTWLRNLSFMDAQRQGLFPHDLAREALTADLRWRNPTRFAQLHQRARLYYMSRVAQGDAHDQRRNLSDYVYLHRDNPMVRPFMTWQQEGSVFVDRLRPGDETAIAAVVEQHQGPQAAQRAVHWLKSQPEGAYILRSQGQEIQGFLQHVALARLTTEDVVQDPIPTRFWRYVQQHAPLREGEQATLFRFWLARDTYQAVSPVQSRIFITMLQHYLTIPGIVYTFLPCAEPDFWLPMFSYGDLTRLMELDFEEDGRRFGVYGRNWRISPPFAWLNLMGERELATEFTPPRPAETMLVLSASDFAAAVRDALRDYTDVVALQSNPLLRSRLILQQAQEGERVATLRRLLREAADTLQASPRQQKLYRAVYHTCFQPAATQEQAAELLDLPFSTYRRHLRAGIEHVTQIVWHLELELSNAIPLVRSAN